MSDDDENQLSRRRSSSKSSKPRNLMQSVKNTVNSIRSGIKFTREKSPDKSPPDRQPQKAPISSAQQTNIERALMERMQKWGQSHNLPKWAQEKMAKAVIKEDERRKKRVELQTRKEQLLKQATLRHAIVVGAKAAEEAKKKAEEAKRLMPEMRKGDSALPYQLKSFDLQTLVGSSGGPSSSRKSTETKGDNKKPVAPVQMTAKNNEDSMIECIINNPSETSAASRTQRTFDNVESEEALLAYIEHLDENDMWEAESKENALFNWIISQPSPDDMNAVVPETKDRRRVQFDPVVSGKTFPSRSRTYRRREYSEHFEWNLDE